MRNLLASWTRWFNYCGAWSACGDGEQERLKALERLGVTLSTTEDFSAETGPLVNADFVMIGKFIQTYCFSDLNARRIIDIVRFARTGKEDAFASKLNETDVLLHLGRCTDSWIGPKSMSEGIHRAAAILQMHRILRNSFAHWGMRRTADGKAYVMLTMHADEVKRRGRGSLRGGEATWGLVLREHVLEELEKLIGHGEYLAKAAAHLNEHRSEFRALHTGDGFDEI